VAVGAGTAVATIGTVRRAVFPNRFVTWTTMLVEQAVFCGTVNVTLPVESTDGFDTYDELYEYMAYVKGAPYVSET
jgi:hypothetical protein